MSNDRWAEYDAQHDETGAKTLTVRPVDSLKQEAIQRAKKVNVAPELMELAMRAERRDRPYVVEFESVEGEGHFYRCTQEGPSRILYINTAHPFFLECYMVPGSTRGYRDKLEIFLWILGTSELDAPDEKTRKFYETERQIWAKHLAPAFRQLALINDHEGQREYEAAMEEDGEWALPPVEPDVES